MRRVKKWVVILFLFLDLGAIGCLLLAYGPNKKFKNFIITTAMSTMHHKYLAHTLYSNSTIDKVLESNTIVETDETTDTSKIKIGNYQTGNYESEEEEQILKKDKGNNLYKLIKIKGSGKTYYITAIYDSSKISLALAKTFGSRGETIKKIASDNDALVAINASGFKDIGGNGNGALATGNVIKDGKLVWSGSSTKWGSGLIGFNTEHKLVLTKETPNEAIKNGMVDAVTFGPFLIVNGKESKVFGNGGTGTHPRTIIAQRQDGIVLFIVIDGNGNKTGYRGGVDYNEMISLLKKYKAYNAANLDGGASSILVIKNEIMNNPVGYSNTGERSHPNAWIVKK